MDLLCDTIMELITNISQETITNLNSVLVEYLIKTIIAWKMLFFTNLTNFLLILISMFIEYGGLNHIIFLVSFSNYCFQLLECKLYHN